MDRTLSRQGIQNLAPILRFEGLEERYLTKSDPRSELGQYLAWLDESDKLAQRVVDAWNAVVQSGDVYACTCNCKKCIDAYKVKFPPRRVADPDWKKRQW